MFEIEKKSKNGEYTYSVEVDSTEHGIGIGVSMKRANEEDWDYAGIDLTEEEAISLSAHITSLVFDRRRKQEQGQS